MNKLKQINAARKVLKGTGRSIMLKTIDDSVISSMRDDVFKKYGDEEQFKTKSKTKEISKKQLENILKKYNIPGRSNKTKDKLVELILDPNAEIYKKYSISIVRKKTNIEGRLTTLQYEAIKDYINKYYEINQPAFTIQDQKKKEEIWNCSLGKSCFSSAYCKKDKGDHIYGIREDLNNGGKIGSDSLWNMVPCTQKENVSWKLNYNGKNLVYDYELLTDDDYDKFTDAQKENFEKLIAWKEYCDEKGAKLYWINGREINKAVTDIVTPLLREMNRQIQELPMISQGEILSIVPPSDELAEIIENFDEATMITD